MNEIKTLNGYHLADETARTAAATNAEAIGQLTEEIDSIKENGGGGTLNPYHNVEEVLFEKQYSEIVVPLSNLGRYAHIFPVELLNALSPDSIKDTILIGETKPIEGVYMVINSAVYPVEWRATGSGSSFHLTYGNPSFMNEAEDSNYPFCIPEGFGQFILVNAEPTLRDALGDRQDATIILSNNPNLLSIEVIKGESGNYIAPELISPEIARKADIPPIIPVFDVPNAEGETPTAEEFNELLNALRDAGILCFQY